jgi:hypothetical protein
VEIALNLQLEVMKNNNMPITMAELKLDDQDEAVVAMAGKR